MKQFFLAISLIAAPVGIFTAGYHFLSPAESAANAASPDAASLDAASLDATSLGDLANLKSIAVDLQSISKAGDLKKAGERVTDFETTWDDAEPAMRPLNPVAWGNIDAAADTAIKLLRAPKPDGAAVDAALSALAAVIDNPYGQAAAVKTAMIDGVVISGPDGRPQPCEVMISQLEKAVSASKLSQADAAAVAAFKTKALERCNADDDLRADEFSAHGIALATR